MGQVVNLLLRPLSFGDIPVFLGQGHEDHCDESEGEGRHDAVREHLEDRAVERHLARIAARRPDVLTYSTPVLEGDVRVAGPLTVSFFVSTSGTDSDWIVKVIDVFPYDTLAPASNPREVELGGYQMLVRGDVLRGKFRNGLVTPEPFVPGEVTL